MAQDLMKDIVNLAKNRGFVYQNSEIYGGLSNTWDYGPLGSELKNNIKRLWWKYFIHNREDMVGLDAAILMNPKVWEASGHISNFNDPMVDCKDCKERFRADHLVEKALNIPTVNLTLKDLDKMIKEDANIVCPSCGKKNFTDTRKFSLMFKTYQGVIEAETNAIYMIP